MTKLRDDRSNATGPNQVWAMDWMHDELFDAKRIWVLTVVDSRISSVMRACHSATAKALEDSPQLHIGYRQQSPDDAPQPRWQPAHHHDQGRKTLPDGDPENFNDVTDSICFLKEFAGPRSSGLAQSQP
jgi:hypothetical protein